MSNASLLHWSPSAFQGLGLLLFHQVLRLRINVFVVEQQCPYPELDGFDPQALHVPGFLPDGSLAAYARILPPGPDGLPHVGRVVVPKEHRRKGYGKALMHQVMQCLQRQYGSSRSALAAQAYLQHFYEGFGYVRTGPEYLLDGIPHVDMVRG